MAPALFTDDYIKRMCPENQPIPLRRMSVLDPTTEPAYLARGFTGIRYVPQPTRPPRNVETLARTMASMRMGTSGYGDDDVRQQRAVIQGFVQGGAPPAPVPAAAPAPNGPAAMDDGAHFNAAGFQYGARYDPPAMDMDDSDDDSEGPVAMDDGAHFNAAGFQYGARVDGMEYVPNIPDSDSDDDGPAGGGPGYVAPKRKNQSGDGKLYDKKGFQYMARADPEPPKRKNEGSGGTGPVARKRIPQNPSGQQYSGKRKNEGGGGGGTRQNRTTQISNLPSQARARGEFMAASRGGGGRAEQGTNLTVAQRRRRRDEEEFQRGAAGDRQGKR